MGGIKKERLVYAVLVLLISGSVFYGFAQTYLPPADFPRELPVAVHVHGITFLAWYALLALQALLVVVGKMTWHRGLGVAGIFLALLMLVSGWLVIAVNMSRGLEGDQFWSSFALMILSNLILFACFFFASIRHRKNGGLHRRLILAAAATGSGAAQFRTLVALFGPGFYAVPTGIAVTNAFILLALLVDRLLLGRWHRVHLWTLGIAVLLESALLGLAFTEAGVALQRALVDISRPLFPLY